MTLTKEIQASGLPLYTAADRRFHVTLADNANAPRIGRLPKRQIRDRHTGFGHPPVRCDTLAECREQIARAVKNAR